MATQTTHAEVATISQSVPKNTASPLPGFRPASSPLEPPVPPKRPLRRIITREQGRALETIGHAVDYLTDCHIYEGPDDEIINSASPVTEAIDILIALRFQLLHSVPTVEPLMQRLWKTIFQRSKPQNPPSSVIPLSSR